MPTWQVLVQSAQGERQCEFRYWDGVRCDAAGLPFGQKFCKKHGGEIKG